MRRLTIWFVLVAVLGLMLGTGQAWAQISLDIGNTGLAGVLLAVGPTALPEPGPLIGAGVVTLMGLGYAWYRRKRATA
jgi:hypothetical protein